ncbi:hypothetical protein EN45_097410 [Penicillium chrysogenum]|uniref:Uncharacterized protein n=2 Tax=Penicillium chrysogenum species complex TaxID=254878 RepID=B6HS94_PENRW|nr:uncharacterized protein N7525_005410 [Penicillium rubens]KAJ5043919.1 hypothetical protein NUH16_000713 [Penicillium rubens]KAJ5840222.1 hypothetical protein N7525_005410 [Penicillium rubens]KZN85554.1 hypothetical protein EN45_097410 [Penicillium chrysogenum]CAP98117.1 hypothetical protein PCH_Pc22g08290 [Penicillium rubens Wisconsin 54-1255]
MPNSKSKSNPLTTPATPIALQPHHLLSPPADLLTNTATTLTITPTQDTKSPSQTFTIHRIRAHESPDSPDRTVPLYTVHGKPWPNTSRVLCDTEGIPVLVLRRVWLSRKWVVRRPDQQGELLVASMPWGDGPGSIIGVGGGFRLEVRFVNALAAMSRSVVGEGAGTVSGSVDEPPPYSAVSGVGVGREGDRNTDTHADADAGLTQRNEKEIHSHPAGSLITSPCARHTCHPCSPSLLPSYDSVRRDSPNSLRDLLDAVELPQEPVPAVLFRSSTSTSSSQNASASTSTSTSTSSDPGIGSGRTNAEASGSKVELRVMQLAASGTGVMMGNQKIMHITRHNAMDYSKSKARLRPRWEVEVAEGVDLLLAVNIVLIMSESSQNRWR